jgi:hypothetical protein
MPTKRTKEAAHPATVSDNDMESSPHYVRREEMLIAHPFFRDIFPDERKTGVRILIVADGDIAFDERHFGLSELINKGLRSSIMPWEKLVIVTAHRSPNDTTSDIPGFKFDIIPKPPYDQPFTIKYYDQVWLFGHHAKRASDAIKKDSAELKVLTDFMNAGGGVFATGDHRDLGAAMCGELPRVRNMRKWLFHEADIPQGLKAPDLDDQTRIDTLREGFDSGYQFDDQSDYVPQEIYPKFKISKSCSPEPHHLLGYGRAAIKVLPDHMHEGECIVPTDLKTSYQSGGKKFDEFPPLTGSEDRLPPETVAVAVSAGGYFSAENNVYPAEPRSYKVIVAYDGHLVDKVVDDKREASGIGRVVVDASFHHFLNINLNGAGSDNPQKLGLYDSYGNPTQEYRMIKRYYRNILTWLCPPGVKLSYYKNLLLGLRYMSPLIEEIQPIENPTIKDILLASTVTHKAITERFSQAEATQCTSALFCLLKQEKRLKLEKFLNPLLPSTLFAEGLLLFINFEVICKTFLGGAMLGLAKKLPESTSDVDQELEKLKSKGERLETLITDGIEHSLNVVLAEAVIEARNSLERFSAALVADPEMSGS